eukprot:c19812_g1_i1 orf=893-2512(-)
MEAPVVVLPTASYSFCSQSKSAVGVSHMHHHNSLCTPLPLQKHCYPSRPSLCSRRRPPSRPRPPVASFASLGFSTDPRISIERAANNLLKDAASLLLYQEVLRVPPAQAFLKVLLGLRRGDEGWKLLDAYGEFYKLMAAGHFLSWEELILEGILVGEGNPFAEALANVGNPRSQWSNGAPASLQAAAAADLDSLQRLSVTECTLVGWVTDLVPDVRQDWKVAAEATLNSRDVKKASSSSGMEKSSFDLNSSKSDGSLLQSGSTIFASKEGSNVCNDALASNRETWRRKIGGLWRWSEAVPLLEEYYAQYGIGRTACEQALQCKGGKLLRDASYYAYKGVCSLSIHTEHREKLLKHFERHISQSGADHILVHGPSGSGRTTLVKSALHGFIKQGKLRVVQMPKSELKHLQGILEELAKNWQLRFVLVVDGLSMTDDLVFMDWPENVMLCGIGLSSNSRDPSGNKLPDGLRDTFGMVLTLDDLSLQSYLLSVEEMLEYKEELGVNPLQGTRKSHMDEAVIWAKDRNVLSVRAAAQFVRSIL